MEIEFCLEDIIEFIIGKIRDIDTLKLPLDLVLKFRDIFGVFGSFVGSEDHLERRRYDKRFTSDRISITLSWIEGEVFFQCTEKIRWRTICFIDDERKSMTQTGRDISLFIGKSLIAVRSVG
jgi:hypothetical protein